jgi:hypothetical protein
VPAAVPLRVRQALWQASQQGLSTPELSERFALPPRTVRHLLYQTRQNDSQPPAPAYRTGPQPRDREDRIFHHAASLKQQHRDWGARFIRAVLSESYPAADLPSERNLRRWLRGQGHPPAPAGRRPARPTRAVQPHTRWQIDACDQMPLATGQQISWLKGVDECSGAALGTVIFPPGAVQPSARPRGSGSLARVV